MSLWRYLRSNWRFLLLTWGISLCLFWGCVGIVHAMPQDFVDQIPGGGFSITASMAAALAYLGRRLLKQNEDALKRAYAEIDKAEEEIKRWQAAYIEAVRRPNDPSGGG